MLLRIALAASVLAACGGTPGAGQDGPDGAVSGDARDASVGGDAAVTPPGSRCTVSATSVACTHNITHLVAGSDARDVYWQTPSTPAPAGGYPIVVLFQGSFGGPSFTWGTLTPSTLYGGFYQGLLQASLLDHGFTVISPAAAGETAWQTNSVLPFASTSDKAVIDALLADIAAGMYGPADASRMYATGISSGGYMTSRMAVSYGGVFRALAIESASYATCVAAACFVPALPADHPPTLFLHGSLDTTVPEYTAKQYYDALVGDGIAAQLVLDPTAGHQWLAVAPAKITDWFSTH